LKFLGDIHELPLPKYEFELLICLGQNMRILTGHQLEVGVLHQFLLEIPPPLLQG